MKISVCLHGRSFVCALALIFAVSVAAEAQPRRYYPPAAVGPDGQPLDPNGNVPSKGNLHGNQTLTKPVFDGVVKSTSLIQHTITAQHADLATKTFKLSGDCVVSTVEKPNGATLADVKLGDRVSISMDTVAQGYVITSSVNDTTAHAAAVKK